VENTVFLLYHFFYESSEKKTFCRVEWKWRSSFFHAWSGNEG